MTQALTRRTYKRKRTRMGFGSQGWAILKLAYQIGGFTAFQHSRLLGIPVQKSYRVLANLSEQKLLEQAPIQTPGRPRDFNYLSKANGSRGILLGGYEAGVRERLVLPGYKRFQLPAAVEHRHAINEYFLSVREAADDDPDVEVPLESMRGESHPGFPLLGEAQKKSDRSNARVVHEKIYPDGLFEVRFAEGPACRYLIEYESRSRPPHVLAKLDSYGAHFSRLHKEDGENMGKWLRPLIFLFPRRATRDTAIKHVLKAISEKDAELERFFGWARAAADSGFYAGRLTLFASLEDLEGDSLGTRYRALMKYPEDKPGISEDRLSADLEAVAEEVDEVVSEGEEGQE